MPNVPYIALPLYTSVSEWPIADWWLPPFIVKVEISDIVSQTRNNSNHQTYPKCTVHGPESKPTSFVFPPYSVTVATSTLKRKI